MLAAASAIPYTPISATFTYRKQRAMCNKIAAKVIIIAGKVTL